MAVGKLRVEQVDLVSFKRIFATTDTMKVVNKDVVFVIPRVNLGEQKTEIPFPYDGKVNKLFVNLPTDAIVTENLVIDIECKQDGIWKKVDQIVVSPNKTSAVKVVLSEYPINMEPLRLNIVNCQEGLVNLVVIVTVLATM